jgi:hypothetical protein
MTHPRRLLLAPLLAAWAGMILACGGPTNPPATQPDKAMIPGPKGIVDQVSAKYEPRIAEAKARIPEDEKAIAEQKDVVAAQTAQVLRAAETKVLV